MIFNSGMGGNRYVKPCDYKRGIIKQVTNETWKATEDCWIYIMYISETNVGFSINGSNPFSGSLSYRDIQGSFYCRKGDTITARGITVGNVFGCIR